MTSPSDADIILVDPTTKEGMTFAIDWPDKIVLDERWAREAMLKGACAFEAQNWGGMRVHPEESTLESSLFKYVITSHRTVTTT